jgi:hypothetical protein
VPIDVTATLNQALTQLEREKAHIDRQIAAIRTAMNGSDGATRRSTKPITDVAPRKRRGMSPAARRAVGKRMKAYWAKRRAAKSKSK